MSKNIDVIVGRFVTDLRVAMRDELLASLAGWETQHIPTTPTTPTPALRAKPGPRPGFLRKAESKKRRPMRSHEAMLDAVRRAGAFVVANPGCRSRDIQRATGLTMYQVAPAMRASGAECSGLGRSAQWYPARAKAAE